MHPEQTTYCLASAEDEQILAQLPQGDVPRQFPTVVAKRHGQIVGYLGTHARSDMILAGPLEVLLPTGLARGVMALRLIQAYEFVLTQCRGVDSYFFASSDPEWIRATARCARTEFYHEYEDGVSLFKRELPAQLRPTGTVH